MSISWMQIRRSAKHFWENRTSAITQWSGGGSNIGKVMDAIRAGAPNTIVVITADNGAWQDVAGRRHRSVRGEKGSPFEGDSACRGSCGHPARFRLAPAMAK
jgi:hypothetical protein